MDVSLYTYKTDVKFHNLTASVYLGDLQFNEGDYYPPVEINGVKDEGREYDEYLIINEKHKELVFKHVLEDLPPGVSFDEGMDPDDRLLAGIKQLSDLKEWRSFYSIEKWLKEKQIPYKEDEWFEID